MKISFLKSKETKNASWLIGGKIIQMLLSLLVGVITARYLGPSNYGLIGYGSTYASFFMAFCTLGINSVIIKEFTDEPNSEGEILGSSIIIRFLSSFISVIVIFLLTFILDFGEYITIAVVTLCSISLLFQAFDSINYWFQNRYQSKITSIATLIAYIVTSIYKIILLIFEADIFWFAFATSIDYLVLGIVLFISYKKNNGPKLSFSWIRVKNILNKSKHYILSGMMVSIYGHTDKFMLKQMLDETSVGYYTTATLICGMWTFVLQAIIDSIYPTIMRLFKENKEAFVKKNKQLYCIVFYISIAVSIGFCFFGDFIVDLLYGKEYAPAAMPLKIITWYTAFSYLGVARNAWIVCEEKQKYLKYMYIGAVFINIALNFILIPLWGTNGAALASLITQIFTSIILPFLIKPMRKNSKMILEAICFYKIK